MVSTPSPPNPYKVADAQAAANKEASVASAIVNNPNEVTPFGTRTNTLSGYERIGGKGSLNNIYADDQGNLYKDPEFTKQINREINWDNWAPRYESNITLSPDEQIKLEQSNALQQGLLGLGNEQIGRIADTLNKPLNLDRFPSLDATVKPPSNYQINVPLQNVSGNVRNAGNVMGQIQGDAGAVQSQIRSAGNVLGQVGDAGAIRNQVRSAGNVLGTVDTTGALNEGALARQQYQTQFGQAGPLQRSLQQQGAIGQGALTDRQFRSTIGPSGQIQGNVPLPQQQYQTGIGQGFDLTNQIGRAPQIQRGYRPEGGFSEDRQRVEEAIMSRIDPQMERDRKALENQLINQGLAPGSEAFNERMNEFRRQQTDARMQAILAGGQEQSRMLGEARAEGTFANRAQAQRFGQQFDRARFANEAAMLGDQRQFGRADLRNQAIGQQFAQNLAAGQFANQAQAQRFGQNVTRADFQNRATQSELDEDMRRAALENQARQQRFDQGLSAGQFANTAQQQAFDQNFTRAQFANDARARQFDESLAAGQFGNQARQQQFDQGLAAGQFANAAQQQLYGQNLSDAQFANEAQRQRYEQALSDAQFANAAQQQLFDQNLAGAQFANEAQQQRFDQNLAGSEFANAAQQQLFDQNLAETQTGMQAGTLNNQFALQGAAAENAARTQRFQDQLAAANFRNAARGQAIQEEIAARSQPINEIGAFLGTGQVNVPSFSSPYRQGINPPDVEGNVWNAYNAELANSQAAMSGLFGLGSAFLGGIPMMFSDRRVKQDVKKVGKTDSGHNVYRYRYKGDPRGLFQLGVMAQEVEKKNPKAVGETVDGIKGVDYRRIN